MKKLNSQTIFKNFQIIYSFTLDNKLDPDEVDRLRKVGWSLLELYAEKLKKEC